jgi:hypothetical protein
VIGNHENFVTFRDALTKLAKQHPNFQWVPEVAIIPMPGGKKDKKDRLLATHGDLQMDDLWFVEDGGSDKERKCFTHKQMAEEKVVSIATRSWAPSAQKQEKGQGVVNWWRKPNATAKTLYAELLYRAQEGDFAQAVEKTGLNKGVMQTTETKLTKRKAKFETFMKELEGKRDILDPGQYAAEMEIYDLAIKHLDKNLVRVRERLQSLDRKSNALFPHVLLKHDAALHYQKLGDHEPRLFTSKTLGRITHINYGHTHVPTEGVEIGGLDDKKITVSNNASVTGALMRKKLDAVGNPAIPVRGEEPVTDLGNLNMLLYRVHDGKIKEITSVGKLLTKHLNLVKQMIRDVPKPAADVKEDGPRRSAIHPDTIQRRRAANDDHTPD